MLKTTLLSRVLIFIACAIGGTSGSTYGLTISDHITASNTTVNGVVSLSSVTAESMTSMHLLKLGSQAHMPGLVIQKAIFKSTETFSTTNTSFVGVSSMAISLALTSSGNYFRISLTGMLSSVYPRAGYLTIKRDSTDLGNTSDSSGLACARNSMFSSMELFSPVGIVMTDSPGDINSHTYQVYIRSSQSTGAAQFTSGSLGYLLVEEISR
jgi:hypothetical protein